MGNKIKKAWLKITDKFQRDEAGRIIVPNRPAYGIIAVLILIILMANLMLLRRVNADTADDSWEILYTSTEDSMTVLVHDYNASSVKSYKYRISADGGSHWSGWQEENIFGLDTKVTGSYESDNKVKYFEKNTTFYLFRCNICGDGFYSTNDEIHGVHSCGGSFYKITINNAESKEKFEVSDKKYYIYECPIDGEKVYIRKNNSDKKVIETVNHCEKIVTYEKGIQYSIQVKRTLNDNKSQTKTLSNVTLNTDSHTHTNDCYIGHNHTVNRCTPIYHTHIDDCYKKVPRDNYFQMKLNADGTNVYEIVNKYDREIFRVEYISNGKTVTKKIGLKYGEDKTKLEGKTVKAYYKCSYENSDKYAFSWGAAYSVNATSTWTYVKSINQRALQLENLLCIVLDVDKLFVIINGLGMVRHMVTMQDGFMEQFIVQHMFQTILS